MPGVCLASVCDALWSHRGSDWQKRDSSAIIAILFKEPSWKILIDALSETDICGVGAPTLVESAAVLTARGGSGKLSLLFGFLKTAGIVTIPFTDTHWPIAADAYERYGKGRHPAALNFGDCLTYAVARIANEPLLCVGNDFKQTDLELAL